MAKKKSKKGSKDGKKGKKGKKGKAPPEPAGRGSPEKGFMPMPELMPMPEPMPMPPPPPPEPPGSAEQKQQTQALKNIMERKMDVWQKILTSPKDEERKEGLKSYKTMAEEELRIIARNISKTKLQELIDQKVNYFVNIGVSDAEDQKLASLQGFKQVADEERVLAAMEAPELARRVFADIKMGELPPVSLQGPPSAMSPDSFGALSPPSAEGSPPSPDMHGRSKAWGAMHAMGPDQRGWQPPPWQRGGGAMHAMGPEPRGPQPPHWPPGGVQSPPGRQGLMQDRSQLMQDAWEMQRRLPKRRLPPAGGTPEVHNKSRLVSEFVEKLAAEIASRRMNKEDARRQLRDVVELENELTETLVSATSVKPDVTEEKLAAIAQMYQDISHTVISNPEMNRDEALSKLKTVAALEHELSQALVSEEGIQCRPFRPTAAEDSAFKLQQLKCNLADELQQNMAVSQPDAEKIQQSIKKLYELELMLMDKLFKEEGGRGRRRHRGFDREREFHDWDLHEEREFDREHIGDSKHVYLKKSRKPATVVEISFSDTDDSDPVIRVVDSEATVGTHQLAEKETGHSCPVHGGRMKPCPTHSPKDHGEKGERKVKELACPVHSEPRAKPKVSWSMHPLSPETVDGQPPTRNGRHGDLRGSQGANFNFMARHRTVAPPPQSMAPAGFPTAPPPFYPYPGAPMVPPMAMYPQYPPYMQMPPQQQPYMYQGAMQVNQNGVSGGDSPAAAEGDLPPAEPRTIIPTKYKGMNGNGYDKELNDDTGHVLGDNVCYVKETWETKPCMPPGYMDQYQTYPAMEGPEGGYRLPKQRPQPNVDVAVDASSMYPTAVTDTEFDQENDPVLALETGIQITLAPSQVNLAPTTSVNPAPVAAPVTLVAAAAPIATAPIAQAAATTISATDIMSAQEPRPRNRSRRRNFRRSASRFRRRRFDDFDDDFDDDGGDDFRRRRRRSPPRSRSRGRSRSPRGRRLRDVDDDFSRRPPRRQRRRRSTVTRRNRASRTETAAEEVPPGVPFWDWICKSICNLLPFSKDAKGSKSHRGANIQRLVDDVMATSQEVVQAKRRLQSTNGSVEASARSMGDLETKLWKLIDLEVDLVNELARYRWSGDVQDPKAEMKLNSAEEKIWRVIGVQTRLAQDLGDWRKTSTRSVHNSGFDPQAFRAPYGAVPGQYGAFGPPVNYGSPGPYNGSFGNPSSRGNNPGMYAGPGNPGNMGNFRSPSPQITEGLEGDSGSESPSLSPSPVPSPQAQRRGSKASRKSKRSRRSSRRKKKGRRRSAAATGSPISRSRRSSKRRNRSRAPGASSSTSNSSTNTSMYTTEPTSTENTSSSNVSTSAGSDQDSVTITNTIIISSELDDEAGGAAKPSAVSWRSPSKEFLSSIDRSQTTPVEWETKKRGKYIYVRAKPGAAATRRSASYGGPDRRGYAEDRRNVDRRVENRTREGRSNFRGPDRYVGGEVDRRGARGWRRGADEDIKISTTISAQGSDGSGSSYDGNRGGYGGGELGGTGRRRRRRFRSAGPINGRSTYQSRSQWSL